MFTIGLPQTNIAFTVGSPKTVHYFVVAFYQFLNLTILSCESTFEGIRERSMNLIIVVLNLVIILSFPVLGSPFTLSDVFLRGLSPAFNLTLILSLLFGIKTQNYFLFFCSQTLG
jgi:hypothetical protein